MRRSVVVSQQYTYTVILEPDGEGGFLVRVPALPEIVTCGDTETDALAMAKDAVELVVASRHERGEDIPESDHLLVQSVSVTVPA